MSELRPGPAAVAQTGHPTIKRWLNYGSARDEAGRDGTGRGGAGRDETGRLGSDVADGTVATYVRRVAHRPVLRDLGDLRRRRVFSLVALLGVVDAS